MIRVHINQDDIDNGVQREGRRCPLARALNRRFGKNTSLVGLTSASVMNEDERGFILLQAAQDFVCGFDRDKSKTKPSVVYLKEFTR